MGGGWTDSIRTVEAILRKVSRGDRVTVVAPSSPLGDDRPFRSGVALLGERYKVSVPRTVYQKRGFLAGTDGTRLRNLARALRDDRTGAIFTARGGHGATRLLARVDWGSWYRRGLPIVGFSDVTALQLGALALAGAASVHGPSVTGLAQQPKTYRAHLFRLLEDPGYDFGPPPAKLRSLGQGRVGGTIVGGNLTMIDQLVGTPYLPDLSGCILLLEDVNEAPYRIDRMLTHLRNAGVLDRVAGIVLGSFRRCRPRTDGVTVEEVVRDHLSHLRVPALGGMPSGHVRRNWAFVQGARVEMRCGPAGGTATLRAI
jgi:muramoyltetrapeptide carboxypeptidase